jgi:hypothetical protein
MPQFLLLPSLVIIAACLGLRWWFGIRSIADCAESTRQAGTALRARALSHWATTDRRASASRAGTLRFGIATPPLALLIVIFAVVIGKIPIWVALAIVLGVTAAAAALGILTLPAELMTIQRFRDDPVPPERVRRAALAEAWNQSIPPVLRTFFGK